MRNNGKPWWRHAPRQRMRGLALVIVLWILTLLTLLASSFALSMRRETAISSALKAGAQAQALAEAALAIAEYRLMLPQAKQRWQADGSVYLLPRADGEIRIRILSEAGKVDINTGSTDQLRAVLQLAIDGERELDELIEAILDWRDADTDARSGGSEARLYRTARLPYRPRDAAFQNLEELQRVLGMTPAIFERIRPFITVYSANESVDMHLADPLLVAAIRREMKRRGIADSMLTAQADSTVESLDELNDVADSFDNENQVYTVKVQVRTQDGGAVLETVVRAQDDGQGGIPFQIMDWRQNGDGVSLFDRQHDGQLIVIDDEFAYNHRP